jgi:drug/metabolite transporter (DMT)-like permease
MKKAYIQLHISIFLWGFTGIFGKAIDLNEVLLVWYRLIITVGVLLILAVVRKNIQRVSFKELLHIGYVGLPIALHWICFYGAIKYSNVSVGVSCLATVAVFTSFLEPAMTGKKHDPAELLLALFSLAGMFIIFEFEKIYTTGIILGLCAAFLGSYFGILNKKRSAQYDSQTLTLFELSSALLFVNIIIPFYIHFFPQQKIMPDNRDWLLLVCFSLFCTVIPFDLSIKALKRLSVYATSLSINLEPVYGVILAFIFFHEQHELKIGFYIGTAMILISVVVYMFLKHRVEITKMMRR